MEMMDMKPDVDRGRVRNFGRSDANKCHQMETPKERRRFERFETK